MLLVGTSIAVFAYDYTALTESWNIPLGGALNIQFSPDGGTLYFVDGGDAVHILDTLSGKLITQLRAEGQSLWSLARSPDGKTLLAGSAFGDVLSWDLNEPTEAERRNVASGGIRAINYSPDGGTVVTGSSDGTISVWDTSLDHLTYNVIGAASGVDAVAISPDGSLIASGGRDGSIKLWDTATGDLLSLLGGHTNAVRRLSFSPSGDLLATASFDGTGRIWRLPDVSPIASLPGYASSPDMLFDPSGRHILAFDTQGNVAAWDAEDQTPVFRLEGFTNRMGPLAVSADGTSLASCTIDELGRILEVLVWNLDVEPGGPPQLTARLVRKASGVGPTIPACVLVSFNREDAGVIAAQYDGTVSRWSNLTAAARTVLDAGAGDCPHSFAASVGSNPSVVRACFGYIEAFDATTGTKKWDSTGEVVSSLALSPEGSVLAAGTAGGYILLLDAIQGSLKTTLHAGEGPLDAMGFSPDGMLIVAANHDGSVEIWDTAAGERTGRFAGGHAHPVALVADPDNYRFAIAYEDGYVQVATTEGAMLTGFQASSEPAFGLAFLDGGTVLATASADGSVVLWPMP